jgi:uncharacterized protein YbjQ (UPF0145 family)
MIFTSGLSCPATVAARQQLLVPVRRVIGNSVFQPAIQVHPRSRGPEAKGGVRELTVWSDLRRSGRTTALNRLSDAAIDAGADAVLSVRLTQRPVHGLDAVEVIAEGTAVRGFDPDSVVPVLTSLGAPELAALEEAGYKPLGLLLETGIWAIVPGRATLEAYRPELGRRNFEHPDFTAGLIEIRRGVLARMRTQARSDSRCAGVVGIELGLKREHDDRAGSSLIVSVDALGTPIESLRDARTATTTTLELGGRNA